MKQAQQFLVKYSNGAKFAVTYFPEPDPKFPYEDRIELKFKTEAKDNVGIRMTFAEATAVVEHLMKAVNAFLTDKSSDPQFDVPLEAR